MMVQEFWFRVCGVCVRVGGLGRVVRVRRANNGRANDGRANDGRANDGRANDGRARP
jgi:hypothetical protein